mmetsp:Transcript_1509/g.2672  ORF Transcript_1509/g.2672 Transcript_1509/m.2672 type:complete len:92 (+) Transcript_1509:1295-1570(+)
MTLCPRKREAWPPASIGADSLGIESVVGDRSQLDSEEVLELERSRLVQRGGGKDGWVGSFQRPHPLLGELELCLHPLEEGGGIDRGKVQGL